MKRLRIFPMAWLAAALCIGGTAAADQRDEALVLGDSVAFAYIDSAGFAYGNPENFVGFANRLNDTFGNTADGGCPGETTGSFLSSTAADFGCRAFRANFPLHVAYGSTQLEFAMAYLKHHHDVRLVTITLGANDGFLLEAGCASQPNPTACIEAGVPTLLATVDQNLQTIVANLRATGYGGAIVLTNYYSLDYSNGPATALTQALNGAIAAAAAANGADVADLFTAFKTVATAPAFGGNSCNAGLLNASVHNQLLCDVHPSQSGHQLITKAIMRALRHY
ncbi:MAG TPA: GDSL-type esterase/lipase family protein [Steroidobacteraceae bacterium]|nr:GDSL-type esterase/lipase family protein [Steroidobacteraceae bacterium]